MVLSELFEKSSSNWVHYSKYEVIEKDGQEWITPAANSEIKIYNPLDDAERLVLDALNTGRVLYMDGYPDDMKREILLSFVHAYGLLGFMTFLPLNSNFMEQEHVFLGSNNLFDTDMMKTKDYIEFFQPLGVKEGQPKLMGGRHVPTTALTGKTLEFEVVFSRNYAEPLKWVQMLLVDYYLHFATCKMCDYTDNPATREGYDKNVSRYYLRGLAFGLEMSPMPDEKGHCKATMVWDFNSLRMAIETLYAVSISRSDNALRMCKHCGNGFYATHVRTEFCSDKCRNQYNVYKFREREKEKQEKETKGDRKI